MVGALLPVVNPLGDAPIFLRMTPGCDEPTRAFLAKRIAFYSFILLLGSVLLGSFVLRLFGLSIPIVQVVGGAVVCALGWKLLAAENPKLADVTTDQMDSVVEPPVTVIPKIVECRDPPGGVNHICFQFHVRTSFDRREFLAGCFIATTAKCQRHGLLE